MTVVTPERSPGIEDVVDGFGDAYVDIVDSEDLPIDDALADEDIENGTPVGLLDDLLQADPSMPTIDEYMAADPLDILNPDGGTTTADSSPADTSTPPEQAGSAEQADAESEEQQRLDSSVNEYEIRDGQLYQMRTEENEKRSETDFDKPVNLDPEVLTEIMNLKDGEEYSLELLYEPHCTTEENVYTVLTYTRTGTTESGLPIISISASTRREPKAEEEKPEVESAYAADGDDSGLDVDYGPTSAVLSEQSTAPFTPPAPRLAEAATTASTEPKQPGVQTNEPQRTPTDNPPIVRPSEAVKPATESSVGTVRSSPEPKPEPTSPTTRTPEPATRPTELATSGPDQTDGTEPLAVDGPASTPIPSEPAPNPSQSSPAPVMPKTPMSNRPATASTIPQPPIGPRMATSEAPEPKLVEPTPPENPGTPINPSEETPVFDRPETPLADAPKSESPTMPNTPSRPITSEAAATETAVIEAAALDMRPQTETAPQPTPVPEPTSPSPPSAPDGGGGGALLKTPETIVIAAPPKPETKAAPNPEATATPALETAAIPSLEADTVAIKTEITPTPIITTQPAAAPAMVSSQPKTEQVAMPDTTSHDLAPITESVSPVAESKVAPTIEYTMPKTEIGSPVIEAATTPIIHPNEAQSALAEPPAPVATRQEPEPVSDVPPYQTESTSNYAETAVQPVIETLPSTAAPTEAHIQSPVSTSAISHEAPMPITSAEVITVSSKPEAMSTTITDQAQKITAPTKETATITAEPPTVESTSIEQSAAPAMIPIETIIAIDAPIEVTSAEIEASSVTDWVTDFGGTGEANPIPNEPLTTTLLDDSNSPSIAIAAPTPTYSAETADTTTIEPAENKLNYTLFSRPVSAPASLARPSFDTFNTIPGQFSASTADDDDAINITFDAPEPAGRRTKRPAYATRTATAGGEA